MEIKPALYEHDAVTIWRAVMLELGSEPQVREGFGYSAADAYYRSGHAQWVRRVKARFIELGLTQGWHSKVTNFCIWLKEQEAPSNEYT